MQAIGTTKKREIALQGTLGQASKICLLKHSELHKNKQFLWKFLFKKSSILGKLQIPDHTCGLNEIGVLLDFLGQPSQCAGPAMHYGLN